MFSASVVRGNKIGSKIGIPTINLSLDEIPEELEYGVYAARVDLGDGTQHPSTLHFGPRPTLDVGTACEVHIIGLDVPNPPGSLMVQVLQKLRDITDFGDVEALKRQIDQDIRQTKELIS